MVFCSVVDDAHIRKRRVFPVIKHYFWPIVKYFNISLHCGGCKMLGLSIKANSSYKELSRGFITKTIPNFRDQRPSQSRPKAIQL